jgi:hypothetical protein
MIKCAFKITFSKKVEKIMRVRYKFVAIVIFVDSVVIFVANQYLAKKNCCLTIFL